MAAAAPVWSLYVFYDLQTHETVPYNVVLPDKYRQLRYGMFLYSGVSSLLDRSQCFTFHSSLADLFIPTPTWLLWKAYQPRSNYAWRLFNHVSTTVYSQVLIYTAEWTGASWRERKCPILETVAKGEFEPGLSWLRVRHSTAELPHSTNNNGMKTYLQ